MKKLGIILSSILLSASAHAQVNQMSTEIQQKAVASEVSDQEMEKFADAFQVVKQENQKTKRKMMSIIQKEGMEVQRFSEIQRAKQNPNQEISTTKTEDEKLSAITPKLQEVQKNAQTQMREKIKEGGLSLDRYQEIAQAIRQNPELRKKLQALMEG